MSFTQKSEAAAFPRISVRQVSKNVRWLGENTAGFSSGRYPWLRRPFPQSPHFLMILDFLSPPLRLFSSCLEDAIIIQWSGARTLGLAFYLLTKWPYANDQILSVPNLQNKINNKKHLKLLGPLSLTSRWHRKVMESEARVYTSTLYTYWLCSLCSCCFTYSSHRSLHVWWLWPAEGTLPGCSFLPSCQFLSRSSGPQPSANTHVLPLRACQHKKVRIMITTWPYSIHWFIHSFIHQ